MFNDLEQLFTNVLYSVSSNITDKEIQDLKDLGQGEFNKLHNDFMRKKRMAHLMDDFGRYLGEPKKKRTPEELEYLDRLAELDRFIHNKAPRKEIDELDQNDNGFDGPHQ